MDVNLPAKTCHGSVYKENNFFPDNIFRKNTKNQKKPQQQ